MSSAIGTTHTHVQERVAGTSSMASLLTNILVKWRVVRIKKERKGNEKKKNIVWSDKTEIPFNILRIIKHTNIRTRSRHRKEKNIKKT